MEQVPHLAALGAQVTVVNGIALDFYGFAAHYLDSEPVQAADLLGVVGHKY